MVAEKAEPSYTELVYDVLRSAKQPLTFVEIFDAVNQRRAITTKNPKATIRNALSQGKQLVSLGDGRYGYLPHLVEGSLLRIPLTEKKPANHPLVFPDEVRHALWPSFLESQKRTNRRPARLSLPNGTEVELTLQGVGQHRGEWGSPMPEGLRKYLVSNYANAGDSVLIRVIDGEAGRGEIRYESRRKRNAAAVEQRNREVADAAYQFLRTRQSINVPIWDLVIALLARGVYHSDVAPDPLETILRADPRFVSMGMLGWVLAEQMTPEVAELVERRRGIEPFRYGAPLENVPPASPAQAMTGYREEASPMPSRRAMERSMADIGAILSQQEFASIDEANAFLQNLLSTGGVPHRAAQTPLDQAQDLMYDAWEAPNPRERVRLAKQALQISPDCADAYVLLAEETTRSPKEAAALYEKAIAAGERALGKEAFAEDVGHFWGILATRPYMRARLGLAQALWAMGRRKEAISHLWDMLRLNPNDNQGVRYMLLGWLLEVGDQAEAGKLLDRYEEDYSATWLYARTLRTFRQEGSTARARALLAEAKEMNPYVPDYLLGRKRLPSRLPATIGSGDESEAIDCAVGQMIAWRTTPGALDWLAEAARSERRHGH